MLQKFYCHCLHACNIFGANELTIIIFQEIPTEPPTQAPSSTTPTPTTTRTTTTRDPTAPTTTADPNDPASLCTAPNTYVRDPKDCAKFYFCMLVDDKYKVFSFNCGNGLAFDPTTTSCNYPWLVPGCENSIKY